LDALVFVRSNGSGVEVRADDFRLDLKRAGVRRAVLFERAEARAPIRLHDLRATFRHGEPGKRQERDLGSERGIGRAR
jgi:hypothetical protein